PLIGVAFRLEMEAMRETATGDDVDPDKPDIADELVEIFERFPPVRAELHYVKLSTAREWLASSDARQQPLIFFYRDQWRAKPVGEPGDTIARLLAPNTTLIL